jgi:ribose transport system ATP-binding protein
MRSISKAFPGVQALDRVDFELLPGEVHVLLGENGAGKSTLMKVLAGIYERDQGEIILQEKPVTIRGLPQAQKLGIRVVLQEFNLIPHLSVAENIVLMNRPEGPLFGPVHFKAMRAEAQAVLERIGIRLDPAALVIDLSVAEKQMVEIAKSLFQDARILILDEPTAALAEAEVTRLFDLIRELKSHGLGIVYISHRFEEIFAIGDRVTVLRDGKYVATHAVREVTREQLIQEMVGRELKDFYPKTAAALGPPVLEVEGLSAGPLRDISFQLRAGEVLGLAGLMGAGRTELVKALFGALSLQAGAIKVRGRAVKINSPRQAMAEGLALLTEDRKEEGLILPMTLTHNVTLTHLRQMLTRGFISFGKESSRARSFIEQLRIVPPDPGHTAETFSGGNQQKIVFAKWLGIEPKILLLDEPTRGIDVGAKVEIFELINRFVAQGGAVLMISSELPELIAMADRILVLHQGRISGELPRPEFSQEKILHYATGGA